MERILEDIRTRLGGATGIAAISSLAGMADTIGCAAETLRRYLRQLAAWRLIIKNQGNATSISGTAGITVALGFPEGLRDVIGPLPSSTTLDPPISAFPRRPGYRSPYFMSKRVGIHPGLLIPTKTTGVGDP
jgi:hypothetical protein